MIPKGKVGQAWFSFMFFVLAMSVSANGQLGNDPAMIRDETNRKLEVLRSQEKELIEALATIQPLITAIENKTLVMVRTASGDIPVPVNREEFNQSLGLAVLIGTITPGEAILIRRDVDESTRQFLNISQEIKVKIQKNKVAQSYCLAELQKLPPSGGPSGPPASTSGSAPIGRPAWSGPYLHLKDKPKLTWSTEDNNYRRAYDSSEVSDGKVTLQPDPGNIRDNGKMVFEWAALPAEIGKDGLTWEWGGKVESEPRLGSRGGSIEVQFADFFKATTDFNKAQYVGKGGDMQIYQGTHRVELLPRFGEFPAETSTSIKIRIDILTIVYEYEVIRPGDARPGIR